MDDRALRQRLLAEVARSVRFDNYVWVLTDPETSVGTSPLADVPEKLLPSLPRLIGLKYRTECNRWTGLAGAAATLGGEPSRSLMWRELLADHGVVDIASCVFRDKFGCWGFLDLWRTAANPFNDAETAVLTGMTATVTTALRRCQADGFAAEPVRAPRPPGPVVLLLSPALEVLGQTAATQAYLRALVPPPDGRAPIPASAYNVAAQLLAVEEGVDGNRPYARVHLPDGRWVSLSAARIGDRNIAVTIEETAPAERVALFGRAFGLSAREAELLGHLTRGADTREVARHMALSEHTVQDHLKSIFAKTATHSRRALVSQALGG